jgi:hypothetical protein
MLASQRIVAGILGADIAVVAVQRLSAHTLPILTGIVHGAQIVIIA